MYDLAGSEIEIINGLPYIIVETEDGYINIPLPLSNTMNITADGVPITVEVDGNYLLIPTEDGIERVCISEFDVELIDGNLMLVHEVNPVWKVLAKYVVKEIVLHWLGLTPASALIMILESRGENVCTQCEIIIRGEG